MMQCALTLYNCLHPADVGAAPALRCCTIYLLEFDSLQGKRYRAKKGNEKNRTRIVRGDPPRICLMGYDGAAPSRRGYFLNAQKVTKEAPRGDNCCSRNRRSPLAPCSFVFAAKPLCFLAPIAQEKLFSLNYPEAESFLLVYTISSGEVQNLP